MDQPVQSQTVFTKINFKPWKNRLLRTPLQWRSYVAKNSLLQKLQIRYENDLEKTSRSLQLIRNSMMLLSSKFHVSELSFSKVTAVQSLTVQNSNHHKISLLTIWPLLSTLPEHRLLSQRTPYEDQTALCVPRASFYGVPSSTPWKSSLIHLQLLAIMSMQSWHLSGSD